LTKLSRQGFDAARACRRIRDFGEAGFLHQDELRVARHAPREAVGQAQCLRMRQHADAVGTAEARRECSDGGAQHIHVGVAPGQHPPCGFGGDQQRLRHEAASLLDPRPQQPQRAEFSQRQELVGVGAEPCVDHAARVIEYNAGSFECA